MSLSSSSSNSPRNQNHSFESSTWVGLGEHYGSAYPKTSRRQLSSEAEAFKNSFLKIPTIAELWKKVVGIYGSEPHLKLVKELRTPIKVTEGDLMGNQANASSIRVAYDPVVQVLELEAPYTTASRLSQLALALCRLTHKSFCGPEILQEIETIWNKGGLSQACKLERPSPKSRVFKLVNGVPNQYPDLKLSWVSGEQIPALKVAFQKGRSSQVLKVPTPLPQKVSPEFIWPQESTEPISRYTPHISPLPDGYTGLDSQERLNEVQKIKADPILAKYWKELGCRLKSEESILLLKPKAGNQDNDLLHLLLIPATCSERSFLVGAQVRLLQLSFAPSLLFYGHGLITAMDKRETFSLELQYKSAIQSDARNSVFKSIEARQAKLKKHTQKNLLKWLFQVDKNLLKRNLEKGNGPLHYKVELSGIEISVNYSAGESVPKLVLCIKR